MGIQLVFLFFQGAFYHLPTQLRPNAPCIMSCPLLQVLWAALFALAVVVRESSQRYVEHMLALAAAGVLPALRSAMAAYRLEAEQEVCAEFVLACCARYACCASICCVCASRSQQHAACTVYHGLAALASHPAHSSPSVKRSCWLPPGLLLLGLRTEQGAPLCL